MGHNLCCKYCKSEEVVMAGKSSSGKQRVKCKSCHRSFQLTYSYNAWENDIEDKILESRQRGNSIRKTAAMMGVGISTVVRVLKKHKKQAS